LREERYHGLFAEAWLVRLVRGTQEGHCRVQADNSGRSAPCLGSGRAARPGGVWPHRPRGPGERGGPPRPAHPGL
jgi:hypothetical protein